ncbi:MAG: phosphotransferase [Actinomycetia bacterium]|nr:phosphotransferase [Actinomycetes bacterium]
MLTGGITNRNLLVHVGAEQFVLRLAGKDTHLLNIDRRVEREATERAASLGISPDVVAFLEPEGYLVTRFVSGAEMAPDEFRTSARLDTICGALRAFHASGPLAGVFDCFRVPGQHRDAAMSRGVRIPAAYEQAAAYASEIEQAFYATPEPRVPCHNDLLSANFLADGDRVWLIDWEYAGMNDRYFDLGNLATNNDFDAGTETALLDAYFGAVTARRAARLALMKVMSDFREAMWGVVQQGISTLDFDYEAYASTHFDRLLRAASHPDYGRWLADAATPDPS